MKESWKSNLDYGLFNEALSKIDNKDAFPNTKEMLLKPWSYCEVQEVKIVVLGTAPINGGLAFAGKSDELQVILDCLAKDTNNPCVEHGFDYTLELWAKQGVILANAALTRPKKGSMTSHLTIWEKFTESWLKGLDREDITFCFFGKHAATYEDCVTNKYIFSYPKVKAWEYTDMRNDFRQQQFFKITQKYGISW